MLGAAVLSNYPETVLAIPTLKFSYGNLLLARLHELGSANIEELLGDHATQLFKSGERLRTRKRGPAIVFGSRECLIWW